MAGITLAEAETHLLTWLDADKAVAKGQSFSISGKTYTRADASVIRENIEFWDRYVKRLSRGGIKVFGGTPAVAVSNLLPSKVYQSKKNTSIEPTVNVYSKSRLFSLRPPIVTMSHKRHKPKPTTIKRLSYTWQTA